MADKLFVLEIKERNGEQEHREDIFIIAPNKESAKQWAREFVKDWYSCDPETLSVVNKNGEKDSLWWTYVTDIGYPSWNATSLAEAFELRGVYHADGCENNKSRVVLTIK